MTKRSVQSKPQWQKSIQRPLFNLLLILLGLCLSLLFHLCAPAIATSTVTSTLIEQGRDYYQKGQYQNAATALEQALQNRTDRGTPLNRALILSYLALSYQQLGQLQAAQHAIATSLSLLPSTTDNQQVRQVRAQVFNTYGRLQLAWGQPEAAIEHWQTAIQDYQALQDSVGEIGAQLNQLQAWRSLGFYRRAKQQLETIQTLLDRQSDLQIKASGLRNLGELSLATGDLTQAKNQITASLKLAQQLQSAPAIAASLLSLGNLEQVFGNQQVTRQALDTGELLFCPTNQISEQARTHYQTAIAYYQQADYQQSMAQTSTAPLQVQASVNRLNVQTKLGQPPSLEVLETIQNTLTQQAPSRSSIYTKVNFAKTLLCLNHQQAVKASPTLTMAAQTLQTALQQADQLADRRAYAYTLGHLGQLHLYQAERSLAKQEIQTALILAERIRAEDIAYQWQWQMAKLLREEGDREQALAYYEEAVGQLQALRRDLVALNADVQFSFRESIEPLYRQFVALLLQDQQPSPKNLSQARDTIEALQLAELDNFFRDACSDATPEKIDDLLKKKDPTAAIFYPIILPDRLEVILTLPQSTHPSAHPPANSSPHPSEDDPTAKPNLYHYRLSVPAATVRTVLHDFREKLFEPDTLQTHKPLALQVYDWLIRPVEAQLTQTGVKTLVFVLDGPLRNIPMAALYDGDRYLIEKYAVALTPGLQLLDPEPLQQFRVNALTGGLSESRAGFPALENVETELKTIQEIIPTPVELLNADFIETKLTDALHETTVSIVHLASHGVFSSEAEKTFILTYDGEINIKELEELLGGRGEDREKIELLVLSACQTAAGDDRAALGLAGIAVRAGARSTLASLWSIDDQSTANLISEFYRQIYLSGARTNKAIALRNAQLAILRDQKHPRYWAAFVLLGNWL